MLIDYIREEAGMIIIPRNRSTKYLFTTEDLYEILNNYGYEYKMKSLYHLMWKFDLLSNEDYKPAINEKNATYWAVQEFRNLLEYFVDRWFKSRWIKRKPHVLANDVNNMLAEYTAHQIRIKEKVMIRLDNEPHTYYYTHNSFRERGARSKKYINQLLKKNEEKNNKSKAQK